MLAFYASLWYYKDARLVAEFKVVQAEVKCGGGGDGGCGLG